MADMNLFGGFQTALSGAGSGLISASKDVESYIQNIYQDTADDISDRKKLFKNLVEKIGIAEDKGIKNILDRYEEFEKEAIALSSKEENRNQKKYSETLQQISLIQGTVQKALNQAFKSANETTRSLIDQIHRSSSFQVEDLLKQAKTFGVSDANLKKIEEAARKEAERNQQRAFREMARALRNTTGAQYEKIRDAVINGLTMGAEDYVKNAYKVVSDIQSKYGINSKDLIQKFNSAFSRITKTPSGVDVVGINTKNLVGSLRSRNISNVSQTLAQQRIKKIYSGYSENIVKQMEEAFGAQQEEMFDLYKQLYSLIDIAQQSGREVAINYNQTLKEMQIGFYKKGTNLSTGRNGVIDMRKIPSFKFSPGRLNQGLISYNGMTAPNDLMLTFDKNQKAVVTTTANLIFNGVKDTLQKVGDKSDEDLMYFLKKSVAESQRGASAEATKFFEKELMDGVSQGRIMNMGGRINVVPAFSKILSEMKKANINIGTTPEYYDQRVFNDLFTMIGALSAAEGKIEKLKNRDEYKYFFQNDGISKMVEGIIRPLASLPLAVGQGSTSQINNGYIQLAANWQRAASFLPGDTSKHLSQTQNYETPYGGKRNKLPSPRFVTKAGVDLGFDYDAPSEKLYNIQYITEEELLAKWDKWLDSKEGKKYLSRGGSKILPGLHGSASIFRDDLLDDFKSQRLRERRVSANQWYEIQRKLGLSGKLDGLSEDERAKLIISDIMGVDIKNMRDVKFGQMGSEGTPDSTKDVAFSFNEIVDWMGNPKGLGAYTGTRSAMMPVPKNFIGKMFGRNIHMIRLAEEMGSNDFGGILVAAIEHELVNNKVSAKEAVEAFNENPELNGLFEVGNDGRLVLSGKMEKTRAINLKSMQKTLQDKFGIRFKSGLTISEPVNPSHDYFYQKETKYGQRELEAMRRAVSSAAQVSGTPEDFEEFWKHEENTVKSKGAEKAKALREVYGQAFRASFGSDELKDDIVDITGEYLSKDAKFAFNEDANLGKVDAESFANSALANIYEQIGKSQKGFGKIKLPEGFKVTHSDGFGKEWTMREIIVPMREHGSQMSFFTDTEGNLDQIGVTLSQFDIALNRVIGSIQNYNAVIGDSAHTQEDEEKAASRLNASLEDFYREDFKYFTSKDSQIVQDIYYNRVKGSHSFMAAGLNKAQRDSLLKSQDQNDRELGKILDESYLIGPEAMRKIIGNNKYDVRAQYEHMFGTGTGKKMKVDDMLDAIIEAMTVENTSNGKFKNIGLLSKNLRFPSIQGQDVRYMRGFVTNSLRGNMETAYIGSSGAAANRTDNDRDHVNIVSVARGMKGVKDQDKFFDSAENVVKLHEAVSRNIRDVEAAGEKIKPEDIEFFGDNLNVTSEGLNKIAAFTALRNRGQIGLLSSQATEIRNFLSDVKFDENAGGRAAGLGQIVRYAFEKAEQDAISYKHVIKRLSEMGEKESGKTAEQAKEEDRKAYAKELEDKIRELQKAGKNEGVTSIDDLLNFRAKLIESHGGQLPFPSEIISKMEELAATPGMEQRLKEGRDTRVFDTNDEKIIGASIAAMTDLENVVSKAWKKEGGYTKTSDYLKELHRLGIFKDEVNGVPFIQAMTQAIMSGGQNFEDYVRELAKEYNVNADALLMSRDNNGVLKTTEKLATMPFEMLVKMVDDAEETLSKNGKNILQRALVSKYRTAGDTSQSDYSLGKFLSEKISGANQIKDTDPETLNKLAHIKAKVPLKQKGRGIVEQALVSMASMGASDEELITTIENIKDDKKKAKELSERLRRAAQQQVKEAKEKNDFSKVGFSNMQSDAPWQLFKASLRDPGHIYSEILSDLTSVDIGGPDKVKSASQLGGFFSGREYNATMRSADDAFNQIFAKYTGTDFSIKDLDLDNYTPQDIKEFNDLRRKKIASDFGTIQHKEIEILGKLLENPPAGLKMERFLQYNSGDTFESKIRSIIGSDSSFSESLQELEDQKALAESNLSKFGYTKEDIERFNNAALFSTLAQTMLVKKKNYKNVAREFSLGMKRDNLTGGQDYTAGTIDQIYYDEKNHRFVIGDSKNKSGADALSQVLQISYGATTLKELIKKYREADSSKKLDAFKKQYGINDSFAEAIQDVINFGNEGNIGGIITKFSTKGGYVESLETNPLTDKETLDLLRRREAGDSSMTDQERRKIEDLQKFVVGIDSRIFANDPSELNIFKYDEIIDNAYQNFIKALEKRANLQKRLYDLEQKGESGSAEYLSAQKEIENLEKNVLAKDDDRYTSIAPTQLAQTAAADAERVAKESVESYKANSAYNEVIKGISEERKLQSEVFKLNKQKNALEKEDAKANEATIKEIEEVLKSYQQSIDSIKAYREQLKALYGDKWGEGAEDGKQTKLKDIETREKLTGLLGARDEKRLADAETNSATKEYIALLNQQLQLELKIKGFQRDAATSRGRQKELDLLAAEAYNEQLKETNKNLEKIDKSKVKNIDSINAENELKRNSAFASLYAKKPYSNIFEYIKSDISRATQRIVDFGLAAKVLNTARKEIQQVYQNILKLDEAMTNLRIITGSNTEQAKSMMNTYNDLAMQLGTTTQAVAQSAAEWLRQGYSVSKANELIKSSTYLSRLGFMDMNQSVTALTSVMKGFRIEATDSMDIVDKLTQLDAKYATTAGDIATALSRTSAVAREAGLNLDQTAAALTTMIDVSQQDASSVGNAFRTILARYGNVKATAFTSLVGDSDDVDDTNKSINDTEKVLGAIGIKIRSSAGDMRDFYEVMDELAEVYPTLDEVTRNAISTALGGTRQRNLLSIMIQNWSQVKESQEEAEKAQGTAARKMQAYNESVAHSINQLSAAWEGFTQKLEASGAVKTFFTGLTAIIENLDHILQYLIPIIATFNADKIVSLAKFLSPLVTTPLKTIKHPIDTVRKSKGAFYENMTQKMTAENTNAIEELTNATKDNTAALRGGKSKSGAGGVGKADEGATPKGPQTDVVTTKQKPYQKYTSDVRSRIDSLNYHISEAEKQGNVSAVEKLKKIKSEELRKIEGSKPEIISAYRKDTRDATELAKKQINEIDKRTQDSKANALMRKEIAENAHKNGQVQSKLKEKDRRAEASQIHAAEMEASGEQQKEQILKERNDRLKEIKKRTKKDLREENKRLKQQEKEYNRANSTGRAKTRTDAKELTPEERANLEAQKKLERSARLKTGVVSGIGAGAVRFANKGSSFLDEAMGVSGVEVDTGEALAMGVAQGALTGVATAFMGPAGAVLASIFGDILSSLWKKIAHADEIDRKQRVEDAKKQLEAIKGIESSVTGLIDLNKKNQALWDSDEWKQFNEQVETINEALEKSELGDRIINLGNSTQTLSEYFEEAARTGNKDMLSRVEAERIRFEAEKTYAAGEQDRYTLQKEINENQKKLAKLDNDEISKRKELNVAIKAARSEIKDYSEALKRGYMQASFYSSGVGTMESYDIGNATLDRVIMQIAREWAKDSPDIFAGNQLTSDARSEIISYLREQPGYSSLFKNDTKNVGDMLTARDAVDDLRKSLNMSQKQLKEFANSKDLLKIGKSFGLIKDDIIDINQLSEADKSAVYKLIDKINLVDEDGITTIAHAMNMTVEEFERANADGAFNWLTADVAIGGIDKLNEKMQTFNDLLSAASEGSLLTSENLNKIANQFPTLLRGVDEAGKYTKDLSSDNILDNIIRMMTDEDSLREIYSGLFSGSVAKDSEIWNNFMTLGKGSEIANSNLSEEIKERIKKAGSYSDIVDIFAMDEMKEYNDAFKEYVTSMYPITDLLDTQAKILEEYGKYTLETEISNLESVRDSLDDVNKQREKELELIKAKEALENASKEKKRIYRAGVGLVYTTDQEAVKSAQEKVDELERQRDKDNIQYQIDSLQQQKEILENIENNKQLESLVDTAERILGSDGSNNGIAGIITAVNSITSDEFMNKIKEQVKTGITESTQKTNDESKESAYKSYKEAQSSLEDFRKEEYVTPEGEKTGYAKGDILNNPRSPYYSSVYDEYKSKIDSVNKYAENYNKYVQDNSEKISKEKADESKQKFGFFAPASGLKRVMGAKSGNVFVFGISPSVNPNWASNDQYTAGNSSNIYISKQTDDGGFGGFEQSPWKGTAEEAINKVKGPALIVNNKGGKDYLIYKDVNGEIHNTVVRLNNGDESLDGELSYDAFFNGKVFSGSNGLKALRKMADNYNPFASGTLSAPGGRSLINENGLESIITPSGTITSLPAKSGIVPADLTRNLWALGEVAPNLIARLGGNSLQTNNSNSSTDNSINIQNLDATFNTQSDFDGRRFLIDLRNQVILTANNH